LLEDGSPGTLGELRVAVAEALITEGVTAARTLTSTYLKKLQTGINFDALQYAPQARREEIQAAVDEVSDLNNRLKIRDFKETYGLKPG
jgi:hypothetical protein